MKIAHKHRQVPQDLILRLTSGVINNFSVGVYCVQYQFENYQIARVISFQIFERVYKDLQKRSDHNKK